MNDTKTWAMSDLESIAKNEGFVCFPAVLLNRIVRESGSVFASEGAITFEADAPHTSNGVAFLKAVLIFNTVKLPSGGTPSVDVAIEQRGERFHVRIGALENTTALGYSFDFSWTDETPAALFPALFSCALEAMRPRREGSR